MTKNILFELPLKVLWMWNCNEAEIAIDFHFKDDENKYQVKGSGIDAFDSKYYLKVCNIAYFDGVNFYSPDKPVYIENKDRHEKILKYWNSEGGEVRYNTLVEQLKKLTEQMNTTTEALPDKYLNVKDIEISKKQASDLVFEIEAIISMLRAVKGDIDSIQIKGLIEQATKGFSKESVELISNELKRKGIVQGG